MTGLMMYWREEQGDRETLQGKVTVQSSGSRKQWLYSTGITLVRDCDSTDVTLVSVSDSTLLISP